MNKKNLIGEQFGKLTIVRRIKMPNERWAWECKCVCGKIIQSYGYALKKGRVKSCGCSRKDAENYHGLRGTRFYRIWRVMRHRCENTSHKSYAAYGGSGIKVCDEWQSFLNFMNDMYDSYIDFAEKYSEEKTTLDRINVQGNYCKENCRWATPKQQANNRSNVPKYNFEGYNLTMSELAEKYKIKYSTLKHRIRIQGMSVENAVNKSKKMQIR